MPPQRHRGGGGGVSVVTTHAEEEAEDLRDGGGPDGGRHATTSKSFCSCPAGCMSPADPYINSNDRGSAVRVECNNDACNQGQYMHSECFQVWEAGVLNYLRSVGRARSWSDKQRQQNLWTKKGYDLAFKACTCRCGKGHLRKDLDHVPEDNGGARKKKNRGKNKMADNNYGTQQQQQQRVRHNSAPSVQPNGVSMFSMMCGGGNRPMLRVRTSSISSTGSTHSTGSPSPGGSTSSDMGSPCTPTACSPPGPRQVKFDFFCPPGSDAMQVAATGSIFQRRNDFSAFRVLPRHKINPYKIKMDDEGPHGNDETRCFLLSKLSVCRITSMQCVLCSGMMPIFDRYPLVDGTLFLSPRHHDLAAMQLEWDGRRQYLCAVCMPCMEGARSITCRGCRRPWKGGSFVLGTCYLYDIFAAVPCCDNRLRCTSCREMVISPQAQGLRFYSQYSQRLACPHCKHNDYHFVKPLHSFNVR